VIDRMVDRGSTVTRTDILGVLNDYHSTVQTLLLEGQRVNTPLANFRAVIRGTFHGPEDAFDAARHELRGSVSIGRGLRRAFRNHAQATRQEPVTPRPNPRQYVDLITNLVNTRVTPGGLGRVTGYRLKVDPGDAAQGIFFVGPDDEAVRVRVLARDTPRELIFANPYPLPRGRYRLEVGADFGTGEVRSGALDQTLRAW